MKYRLTPYSIHELGQRQNQEDALFPAHGKSTSDDRLFILCDGMGGHEKGEVASATVCEAMSNTILSRWSPDAPLSDELLLQAIDDAYDALDAKDGGEAKKMGTTMTLVCFHSDGVTVAHIGDSRVYQLRPAKGKTPASIEFQTRDHSLVNDLIKLGEITEEDAKNHPQKNVITRAMQPCQERRCKADIAHLTDVQPGDYFYMCSDGMLEQTSNENLLYIITKSDSSNEQKVEMLLDVTSENKDNHTAHLIHVDKVEGIQSAVTATASDHTEMEECCSSQQTPHGTLVVPEMEEERKKSRTPLYIILALLGVIVVALCAYLFVTISADECSDADKDSLTNVEQVEELQEPKPAEDVQPAKNAPQETTPKDNNATPLKGDVDNADALDAASLNDEQVPAVTNEVQSQSSPQRFLSSKKDGQVDNNKPSEFAPGKSTKANPSSETQNPATSDSKNSLKTE